MEETTIKKQKAQYRSAIRSKRLIRDAYISLMQEKEADKISVSDIVRLADLNRGTFYAHYTTPNDVREEIADEIFQKINEILIDFSFANFLQNPSPVLDRLEKALSENMQFYKEIMCYTITIDFIGKVKKSLVEKISTDNTIPEKLKGNPEFLIALDLFAGGIISLYADIVQGKLEAPIEQVTKTLAKITMEGTKSLLNII